MESVRPLEPAPAVRRSGATEESLLERLSEPGVCDVRDRLLARGASPQMTAGVVRAVLRKGARGAWAIDAAAQAIGRSFGVQPSPRLRRGAGGLHTIAFVGPTGCGKTTTVAKLGRRLEARGRRVLLASLDDAGATALHAGGRIEADRDRTELPLVAVRRPEDLRAGWKRAGRPPVALLDTPPLSPRETGELDALARELERLRRLGSLDVMLVLPATMSRAAADLALGSFERMAPTSCVLTKLDETTEPLIVLEAVGRRGLPFSFLCDGVDARRHLARPTPGRFADLALRGRFE